MLHAFLTIIVAVNRHFGLSFIKIFFLRTANKKNIIHKVSLAVDKSKHITNT